MSTWYFAGVTGELVCMQVCVPTEGHVKTRSRFQPELRFSASGVIDRGGGIDFYLWKNKIPPPAKLTSCRKHLHYNAYVVYIF